MREKIAGVVEGAGDVEGEGGDFGGGRDNVGDHDDVEAGGVGGADAGVGVFERVAGGGFDAEAADGFEIDVGLGFAAGDFIAADEDGEVFQEADLFEAAAGVVVAGGGGDGERDAARGEVVEDFADAWFEGKAVLQNVILEEFVAFLVSGLEVKGGTKGGRHEDEAFVVGATDEGGEERIGHVVTEKEGGFLPGDAGDALGVEHEAVHVEDDGGEHGERLKGKG